MKHKSTYVYIKVKKWTKFWP